MSYKMTRENQPFLLTFVQDETNTEGWRKDAIAYGAVQKGAPDGKAPLVAAAVFENFAGGDADFSFAMVPGYRMNRSIIEAFTLIAFHPRAFNLNRLWMQASEHNLISQRALLAIGATFQFRKRAGQADGSDAIVFLMERPPAAPPQPAARAPTNESDEG